MRKSTKILLSIFIPIIMIVSMIFIYLNDHYQATDEVKDFLVSTETVEVFKDENNYYTFKPKDPTKAIIFYPGGKVDSLAYSPLLYKLAEEGYLTILIKMPFNLAVLNTNAADKVRDNYPEIDIWYLAGHSLGGSMAASHLAKNSDRYDGLILLGSYSTVDLMSFDISVISIYGEFDYVLNKEKYQSNKRHLPNLQELIITGGNHAYFGYYGEQSKDGISLTTRDQQIEETITYIITHFWQIIINIIIIYNLSKETAFLLKTAVFFIIIII